MSQWRDIKMIGSKNILPKSTIAADPINNNNHTIYI